MRDEILFLRPAYPFAPRPRKVWTKTEDGVSVRVDVNVVKWRGETCVITDLASLAGVVSEKAGEGDWIAVRGSLAPSAGEVLERRSQAKPGEVEPPLLSADRRWILLDLDKKEAPYGWATEADCVANASFYRNLLPLAWREAECFFRLSSSAGIPGQREFGCHLYFWADRPVCDKSLKAFFSGLVDKGGRRLVDVSLFQPQQPHFLATPAFEGMSDPVAVRGGMLAGDPLVLPAALLSSEAFAKEQTAQAAEKKATLDAKVAFGKNVIETSREDRRRRAYADKVLSSLQQEAQDRGASGRHDAVKWLAAKLRKFENAGIFDEGTCLATIEWAKGILPDKRHKEATDLWAWAGRNLPDSATVPDFCEPPVFAKKTLDKQGANGVQSPPVLKKEVAMQYDPDFESRLQVVAKRFEAGVLRISRGEELPAYPPYRVVPASPPSHPLPRFEAVNDAQGEGFLKDERVTPLQNSAIDKGISLLAEARSRRLSYNELLAALRETLDIFLAAMVDLRKTWWQERIGQTDPVFVFVYQNHPLLSSLFAAHKGNGASK